MITIYTKEPCSWCVKAKNILKSREIPFTELKLDEDFDIDQYKTAFPGRTTLPLIILDGRQIGGYEDLRNAIANNPHFGKMILNEGF